MMLKKNILPTFMQFQKMIADKKQREKWEINKIVVGDMWAISIPIKVTKLFNRNK